MKYCLLLAILLGMALATTGQTTESITIIEEAVRSNPSSAEAWYKLGVSKFRRTDAKAAFEKAIEIKHDYAEAYYALGAWYLSRRTCLFGGDLFKKLAESETRTFAAVNLLKKAIELKPIYPQAFEQLGQVYKYRLQKSAEAAEAFEMAIKQGSKASWVYVNLAQLYSESGRYEEAIRLYKSVTSRTVDQQSTNVEAGFDSIWIDNAFRDLARLYVKLDRNFDGWQTYEEIIRFGLDDANTHYELGLLYVKEGNKTLAEIEHGILKQIESETDHVYSKKEIKRDARELLNLIKKM